MADTTNHRQYVLGYPVDLYARSQALIIIKDSWVNHKGIHVITLNAEMVMSAQEDQKLDNIVRHADLIIPDGAGIVLALKLQGYESNRLPGIELAYSSLQMAAENNIAVALVGASADVLDYLKSALPKQIPGLKLVFCHNGYFSSNEAESVIAPLSQSHAQLVLVAMGVPRQEYFIEKAKKTINDMVFIGVGGSFDVWAGKIQRAAKIWQDFHLEWLYRLISEPWRFKRMSSTLPKFAGQVILEFFNVCFSKTK